jgi:hypothetical protein
MPVFLYIPTTVCGGVSYVYVVDREEGQCMPASCILCKHTRIKLRSTNHFLSEVDD